jgi:hypothetical protein
MEKAKGLSLLREPFPDNQVGHLPKGTKAQNECPANEKINCKICGGWHHPKVVHLDYIGHAALTDRLLDADPLWSWEPMALKDGLPAFDTSGGLWIRLTVCGHTRVGYGHAAASQYKEIGSREKEVIGDALRNAAMRFGAALELWHKGELHVPEPEEAPPKKEAKKPEPGHPSETLRKLIEAKIGKEKIDRERFKEWLFSVGWIELKEAKPSMSTLTEARAKKIADKWDSALKTYNEWLAKG